MSYIERGTALEFVLNNTPHINGETTMKCVARAIKEVPTADVAEVRRESYALAVRTMQNELKRTVSALCKGDVSEIHRMIDQVADEQLGVTE